MKLYKFSICMAHYEALYGRRCRTPICWIELNEHNVIGSDIVKKTEEKFKLFSKG